MESRAPTFADLTFNTIGKAPSLLGRLSSPGPSVTALPASPSPSPQPITRILAPSKTISKSRPSLLESLASPMDGNESFLPSPHNSISQPRSNGSKLSILQYPPTPPTDCPPRVTTTLVEQPPLSALSALKDRLSSISTSFQPPDLTPAFNLAQSSREQSVLAQESARRAVALSLDSIRAAQASSTAAQESFTAAERADTLSSDLLVSLDKLSTQLKALDSLNSIHDISTKLSVWVAREETSRAALHSSHNSEFQQIPTASSGLTRSNPSTRNPQSAVKVEGDVHMTSSETHAHSQSQSTSLFPTIPSDIPIDDDLLDEKESLGKALGEVRRARENTERLRRETEDAELQRVKQRLLDAVRGADQFEEELNRARRSREAAARADYERQTRQCLEDARKAKEARREAEKLKAAADETQRKAALRVAEEEAKLKADEEAKHRVAEEHSQKQRRAAQEMATRLKLEREAAEERRRLEEAAAKIKLQRQLEAQEKAEKERQAEYEEKQRKVKERRAQALLQNAQEAQKHSQTTRVSQSPVRNIPPSTVPSNSKPAKPTSNRAISGGVSLGHSPATRNEALPTETMRSVQLDSRQHPTSANLPPSLPPKPQQALSSRNHAGGPESSPCVPPINHLDDGRGRSSSESDEFVPWSTHGNNGNVSPSVQQSNLPHIATKRAPVVTKTEPVEVSMIPPPPLPHKKALQSSAKKQVPTSSGSQNAAASASSQSSSSANSQSSVAPAAKSKSPLKKGPPGVTTLAQKSAAPPQQTKKQAKAARPGGTTSKETNSVPKTSQPGGINGKLNVPQQSPLTSQPSDRIDQPKHAPATHQFNGQSQPPIAPAPRSRRAPRGDHYSPSPDRYDPPPHLQPSPLRDKRPRDVDDDLGRADNWGAQRRRSDSPSLMNRLDTTSDDFAPMDYGAPRQWEPDSPPSRGYRHMTPSPQDDRSFYPAKSRMSTNGKQPRGPRGGVKRGGAARGGGPNQHMRGNMSADGPPR
ncbi:hypothetical protein BDZ89DRAFT_1068972 [Hymenopellis radicata]|nr:hypothetical protein BDZ89DRAFT_1068972 [Hymenopellis radicata]